jgi:hypothetical protein
MGPNPIRVGVLACERFIHTNGIWGPIIDPESEKRFSTVSTRMTNMVLTHAWDINRNGAEGFARSYKGVEVVDHYYDMVDKVDGIILDDFDSCLHFKDLARPYLEAGVPMFINRPFALNLADARCILDLARKHGTPIMTGSSFEYAPEVEHIRSEVAKVAPLSGYCAANSMSDYATHGLHGLWFVYACVGGGIRSASYQTPDWRHPNGIVVIEYEGRDGGKPFYGCVQETTGSWGWIRVFGSRSFEQSIHSGLFFWVAMVLEMQKLFETRKMPQSHEAIFEKVQLFLAGFKSHVECKGAPVALDQIGDWTAPLLNPDPYPAGFFG